MILTCTSIGAIALATGCDDDAGGPGGGGGVVATTTQLADIAANVAGDRADVTGLLAPNSDPHDYEPKPSDAEAFVDASVVVESGGDLDVWADDLIESSGYEGDVVTALDEVETIEGGHEHEDEAEAHEDEEHSGEVDPHWWQNPENAVTVTEAIRDALIQADPEGATEYERNADRYIGQIEVMDAAIQKCIDGLPPDARKLVTTHDALGYYADRYGLEITGAAIPALTTQAQPSAGETSELVDLIRDEGVSAIFPESGINPDLEQAIADEAGARVGGILYADALGDEGTAAGTYLGSLAQNTQTIVFGLGNGEIECEVPVSE